ncbi:adenylate/guanylate cyclase domain-containing protein [Winogradskya humida]|nr:adenylate/guanylate cyclase domain-containing protein [Actinoplanes humidus]
MPTKSIDDLLDRSAIRLRETTANPDSMKRDEQTSTPSAGRSQPTFVYIVVVDIEGYGSRSAVAQASLRAAMYEETENAFEDAGLNWESVVKLDRGDGLLMLVPPTADAVTLAGKFVIALNESLREKAGSLPVEHQMRMRVALHQGDCWQDRNQWVGAAINTASLLVDAAPLRAALFSAPRATMAVIASDGIYRSLIRHGFRHLDPASFAQVEVSRKEQHEIAWVQVPGYPYPPALGPASTPKAPVVPWPEAFRGVQLDATFSGNVFGRHESKDDTTNRGKPS